jgi:hypothetical protein
MTEIIGVARRKRGALESVQYRNKPTFLIALEEAKDDNGDDNGSTYQ